MLSRLRGLPYDGNESEYTLDKRAKVIFNKDRIYLHNTLRVNYTTYDVQRKQDLIRPQSHIMVLSREDSEDRHPYWYARVLGIFHAEVSFLGTPQVKQQVMRFLWIRWMGLQTGYRFGWAKRRLPRVGFICDEDTPMYSFLNPAEVLRSIHLLPVQSQGYSEVEKNSIDPLSYSKKLTKEFDWYDVNWCVLNFSNLSCIKVILLRFADRDMFMRYRGGGIGHTSTCTTHPDLLSERENIENVGDWDGSEDVDVPNDEEEDYEDLLQESLEEEGIELESPEDNAFEDPSRTDDIIDDEEDCILEDICGLELDDEEIYE